MIPLLTSHCQPTAMGAIADVIVPAREMRHTHSHSHRCVPCACVVCTTSFQTSVSCLPCRDLNFKMYLRYALLTRVQKMLGQRLLPRPLVLPYAGCTVLFCTVLYCTVLYCSLPPHSALCAGCTVLYCTALYCTVCTVLHCTVLYCTVLHCSLPPPAFSAQGVLPLLVPRPQPPHPRPRRGGGGHHAGGPGAGDRLLQPQYAGFPRGEAGAVHCSSLQ